MSIIIACIKIFKLFSIFRFLKFLNIEINVILIGNSVELENPVNKSVKIVNRKCSDPEDLLVPTQKKNLK
jgi:hypothetical protein